MSQIYDILNRMITAMYEKIQEADRVRSVNGAAPDAAGNVKLTASDVGALPKTGGTMSGAVTTKGLVLTKGVDYGDSLPGTVTPGKLFFLRNGSGNGSSGNGGSGSNHVERYTGDYQVTPTASGQTLETSQKLMTDDVTIQAIPFSSVGNNSGGKTIYIGGANEINKT